MLQHTLSSIAESDLTEIWAYFVEQSGSVEIAEEFLGRIQRAIEIICNHPRLGSPRPDLDTGLRSFPVGNYLIIYRITSGDVWVDRVLHGKRDLPTLFGSD